MSNFHKYDIIADGQEREFEFKVWYRQAQLEKCKAKWENKHPEMPWNDAYFNESYANDLDRFTGYIQWRIIQGWQPYGPLLMGPDGLLLQAMTS